MSPLPLSLCIALLATLVITVIAVPLAYVMARARFAGRSAVDTLLTLPLVLPPTVVGYGLVVLFGARGWIGGPLRQAIDYSLLFRLEGAVLAAAVVAFPLLYRPAKAAFSTVDREFEDEAALLGAGRWQTFWHVAAPIARRGIFSGQALAFARAFGEFGATVMVFGWRPGNVTAPIAIYSAYERGAASEATPLVLMMLLICFGLLVLMNRLSRERA